MRKLGFLTSLLLTLPLAPTLAHADEGMWPFNMVPRAEIQKRHGVAITDSWLDHVRLASVRFNSGGSGSFVSPTGLVLTNHHVAGDCIAKMSTAQHDYLATGYVAGTDGGEIKCPDLELNQLVAMQDVTERVRAARKDGMSDADANVAMKGEIGRIEKECQDKADKPATARCDVVTLYGGGKYHLYTYRKYTDVRLVFAPEADIAFFGGDPDNFTYPRYDYDLAIFRIYEDDKPIAPKDWLKWNPAGPKDGEAVFTSGHPGRTDRNHTIAQLETTRDHVYPYVLEMLGRERAALKDFGRTGAEAAREAREPIFGIENGLKAITGMEGGLKTSALMKKKREEEAALRKSIDADPKLKAAYGSAFDDIAHTQKTYTEIFKRYAVLEAYVRSDLLHTARDLVRLSTERDLPNDKRLAEYRESALPSLKLRLFSPAPVYGGVEVALIRSWLERLVRDLGAEDPTVKAVLAGRTPEQAARAMVVGSKLSDVYARKKLFEGGKAAIEASTDPIIVAIRALDPAAREVRKRYDDEVEAPMRKNGQRIAEATFAVKGTSAAPDATFTLRLSSGVVKGYTENGKAIPWSTDFAGMYAHATGKPPLKLPARWIDHKKALDLKAPLNFVSTNDIIGGNSGSPVINANGELVGLIFDGNISSLPNRFVYGETTERAVSVDTAGILEALRKVYGAEALVKELAQ
jgi:S1-C subfamily serine protease